MQPGQCGVYLGIARNGRVLGRWCGCRWCRNRHGWGWWQGLVQQAGRRWDEWWKPKSVRTPAGEVPVRDAVPELVPEELPPAELPASPDPLQEKIDQIQAEGQSAAPAAAPATAAEIAPTQPSVPVQPASRAE